MKTKNIILQKGNPQVKISIYKHGFSVWIDGRWIIDAGSIVADGKIIVGTSRLKKVRSDKFDTQFVFKGDNIDRYRKIAKKR